MKKMNTLSVNGNTYVLEDAGAVAFDRAQTLTDDEKQQALKNLGLGGQYELIEDITLEEAVASFKRNTAPDGSEYNFTAVRIITEATANTATANLAHIVYRDNNYLKTLVQANAGNGITTSERSSFFKCYNDHGLVDYYFVTAAAGGNVGMYRRLSFMDNEWQNIKAIELRCSVNIPAGTRIRIYAIRG